MESSSYPNVNTLLIRLKANRRLLEKLSWRIIDVWNSRSLFLRFLDGDKTHVSRRNVRLCTLRDLLVHFDEWTIDWERDLTAEEIELVSTTNWVDSVRAFHLGPVPIVTSDLRYRVTTRCDDD